MLNIKADIKRKKKRKQDIRPDPSLMGLRSRRFLLEKSAGSLFSHIWLAWSDMEAFSVVIAILRLECFSNREHHSLRDEEE
jgi:hypothetical protein